MEDARGLCLSKSTPPNAGSRKRPSLLLGREEQARRQPYFCVQRHDATRLHYDFRLEIDGVLKSWAVPKGPTLDPAREASSPRTWKTTPWSTAISKATFRRAITARGSVMLWDRGTFELLGDVAGEAQLARGDLKFRLHGEKLKGDFAIVHMKGRGKGNEWLLIKKRDEFAAPGWDVEALRLQRALRPHAGRDRAATCRRARPSARRRARPTASGRAVRPAKRARASAQPAASAKPAPAKKKPKYRPRRA